jgi:hypothetical protein
MRIVKFKQSIDDLDRDVLNRLKRRLYERLARIIDVPDVQEGSEPSPDAIWRLDYDALEAVLALFIRLVPPTSDIVDIARLVDVRTDTGRIAEIISELTLLAGTDCMFKITSLFSLLDQTSSLLITAMSESDYLTILVGPFDPAVAHLVAVAKRCEEAFSAILPNDPEARTVSYCIARLEIAAERYLGGLDSLMISRSKRTVVTSLRSMIAAIGELYALGFEMGTLSSTVKLRLIRLGLAGSGD